MALAKFLFYVRSNKIFSPKHRISQILVIVLKNRSNEIRSNEIRIRRELPLEAIYLQNHRNRRNLNCFYSIFAEKCNSHSHFRYIKNIKLYLRIVVLVLSLCVHPKEIYYFLSTSHCATLSCLISTGRKFMSRWNVFLHFIASVELGWSWSWMNHELRTPNKWKELFECLFAMARLPVGVWSFSQPWEALTYDVIIFGAFLTYLP